MRERGRGVEEGGRSIEGTRLLGAVNDRELNFSLSSFSPCTVAIIGNCVTATFCLHSFPSTVESFEIGEKTILADVPLSRS